MEHENVEGVALVSARGGVNRYCEACVIVLRLALVVAKRWDPKIDKLHGAHSNVSLNRSVGQSMIFITPHYPRRLATNHFARSYLQWIENIVGRANAKRGVT